MPLRSAGTIVMKQTGGKEAMVDNDQAFSKGGSSGMKPPHPQKLPCGNIKQVLHG